jgi:Ca2+:H+ antiporter
VRAILERLPWTTAVPVAALVALALTWSRYPGPVVLGVVALLLGGSVLAAVHHAEVIAHRVGEPFGSLVLAVAVTVIEVALIVTLMVSTEGDTSTLARDTVFAAVMICLTGIVGVSLLIGSLRTHLAVFNPEGSGAALATVITLAALGLVAPSYTTTESGPEYSGPQLAFAAVCALALYGLFLFTQTVRHRDFFLPVPLEKEGPHDEDEDGHADPPSDREALTSLLLLTVALVAVVGLAKVESPAIEAGVAALGFPASFVGVVIAMLVLGPEFLAAANAARKDRVQTSLNLAYGSSLACIGLTIPTIAVASIWLEGPLYFGLDPLQVLLLLVTVLVSVLTVVPGRAKPLQAGIHLALFAAFLFLSVQP